MATFARPNLARAPVYVVGGLRYAVAGPSLPCVPLPGSGIVVAGNCRSVSEARGPRLAAPSPRFGANRAASPATAMTARERLYECRRRCQ
jgi:hypothetical protein